VSVRVGEIAEQLRGVSYEKSDAISEPRAGFVPILRANNITDDGLVFDDLVYIPKSRVSQKQALQRGDIVIAASSGSLDVVGKAAQLRHEFQGAFGAFCKVLRPKRTVVDPDYLSHFFRTPAYQRKISSLAAGANINNLKNEHLDGLEILLPPLGEQRRIASILDKADALRRKRKRVLGLLGGLASSIFLEMFDHLIKTSTTFMPLGELADIVSGITKGRKLNGEATRELPYLAVANVQDKRLDLSMVKTIAATESEIDRYRLQKDDLLLTEGGDPDKLGRGTLWGNELSESIHQNHIFRARVTSKDVLPIYLIWLLGSSYGKAYFLRSAKQTTGIASINKRQLSEFPVILPSMELQRNFASKISVVKKSIENGARADTSFDMLFSSLQHRAFYGQL